MSIEEELMKNTNAIIELTRVLAAKNSCSVEVSPEVKKGFEETAKTVIRRTKAEISAGMTLEQKAAGMTLDDFPVANHTAILDPVKHEAPELDLGSYNAEDKITESEMRAAASELVECGEGGLAKAKACIQKLNLNALNDATEDMYKPLFDAFKKEISTWNKPAVNIAL